MTKSEILLNAEATTVIEKTDSWGDKIRLTQAVVVKRFTCPQYTALYVEYKARYNCGGWFDQWQTPAAHADRFIDSLPAETAAKVRNAITTSANVA